MNREPEGRLTFDLRPELLLSGVAVVGVRLVVNLGPYDRQGSMDLIVIGNQWADTRGEDYGCIHACCGDNPRDKEQ